MGINFPPNVVTHPVFLSKLAKDTDFSLVFQMVNMSTAVATTKFR